MEIVQVKSWGELNRFLQFPQNLYEDLDLPWIPHLLLHQRWMMGNIRGSDRAFFLAQEEGQVVGRIAAKIHTHGSESYLHFGFFECRPARFSTAQALFAAAQELAPSLVLRGPYHFRMEDPFTGVLVEGYQHAPSFLMSYSPPYYREYFEQAGFEAAADLRSYRFLEWPRGSERWARYAKLAAKRGVQVRSFDRTRRWPDVKSLAHLFNSALADNWGFEDFTRAHQWELFLLSFIGLDPDLVFLAEVHGEVVGALVILPDYNPLQKGSRGRPSLKLLRGLLWPRRFVNSYRGWALAVLPEARLTGAAVALIQRAVKILQERDAARIEVSWVLAQNQPMNLMLQSLGAEPFKRHRIYQRDPLDA